MGGGGGGEEMGKHRSFHLLWVGSVPAPPPVGPVT